MTELTIRPALPEDADLLLEWRNDPETRRASHSTGEVDREGHLKWFFATLKNPNRKLFIAEKDGSPVGTVRADIDESATELSWTVSPEARGAGVAKKMVSLISNTIVGTIRAEVKAENIASVKVATSVGMTVISQSNGIIYLERT